MKQFKNLSQPTQKEVLAEIADLNYYGKRLKSKKLEVCENALLSCDLSLDVDALDLANWLDANQPAKAPTTKAEKAEIEPTFRGSEVERDALIKVLPVGRYIVTSAQNNTAPHAVFSNLVIEAQKNSAQLLVMPIIYNHPLEKDQKGATAYHPDFDEYLLHDNVFIGSRDGVRLAVTANILPTAKQPINTAVHNSAGESVTVVASPKCQTKTLNRMKGSRHRWAYTSRCSTIRHYIKKRAGDEAEKDHTFGALYFEVFADGKILHQEIIANEQGEIINPITRALPQKVVGMVAGDLHCEKMSKDSLNRLINQVDTFKPETLVCHDVLDFMSRNHHNRQSGRFLYQMGSRTVIQDLTDTVNILNLLSLQVDQLFIVFSNHDDALSQWLDSPHYNPDQDPLNAKTYHLLKYSILDFIDNKTTDDELNCFSLACEKLAGQVPTLAKNIVFGDLDQKELIASVEVGQHGHIGTGGARGSVRTFKGYGMPIVIGHSHSPNRDGTVVQVGVTGSLEMGYNKGGSAWDRSNALIFENGLISMIQPYLINDCQD